MPQQDKLSMVWRYLDDSEYQHDTLRQAIEESDDYYFGRLPAPPAVQTGRSCSVSMDVQSVITATQAAIMEGLTIARPASFVPQGDQDSIQAELESQAVTDAIMDDDGTLSLSGAVDNALRYHFCVMRSFVDKVKAEDKRVLPDANATELAQVVAAIPAENDPVIRGDTVAWSTETEQLIVENIDPARLRYPKDHPNMDFDTMPFVAIEHRDLRADLIEMGFDKAAVDDLPKWTEQGFSDASIRSKHVAEERSFNDAPDPALDYVQWFECWFKVPQGDGTTTLERIVTSNRVELDSEPATHVPLSAGGSFPQPHRFQSISMASKVIPVSVSKTEAIRQFEDNLAANNNPRSLAFDVNTDDATNGRVDGVIRAESAQARYEPIPVQDLSAGSLSFLSYMDKIRSEVGGAALDMQQPESEMIKSQVGAVASQTMLSNQELMSAFVASNIGNTLIRSLYLTVHRTMREDFTGQVQLERAGQMVPVQPRDWAPRHKVKLTAGMSPMARNRKAANLQTVMQTQLGLMGQGMPLADPQGLHAAITAWGYSVDLPITNFFTDPASEKGQQMAQQAAQQAQQQQQMQQQLAQAQLQIEAAKIAQDRYDTDIQAKVDIAVAQIKAELEEAKMTLEAIRDAQQDTQAQPGADNGSGNRVA